jgi:uncharacterized protein (DUF2132 family)
MPMTNERQKHIPEGVTLEMILNSLAEDYGWEKLGRWIKIKCFTTDPSVQSSLKFLRKTPWARTKVENLYLSQQHRLKTAPSKKNIWGK